MLSKISDLSDFIEVCKTFNIIDSATWTTKIMILKKAENNFVIERYINKNDKWNKYYLTRNEEWREEERHRSYYSDYKSYEEHKDEVELTKPANFEILYERKIALSDKGLAFYNKLTEVV